MTVAIIHDVFIESGGAERVLIELLKLYPEADIYIPLLSEDKKIWLQQISSGKITTSLYTHLPFLHSASILLKPLLFWYWETLDLKKYDLVISSSHSFSAKSVITSPDTLHLSYIHTPPRYLYTEFNETRIIQKPLLKSLLTPLLSWLRTQDFLGAQRPDVLIANSKVVQRRIAKYYRRRSIVIAPPIAIPSKTTRKTGEYFLCYSRLAKQKGIELAIAACNQLQLPLVVVGEGAEASRLHVLAGPTVTFKGYVPDDQMPEIFAHAKALIYCSIEEDFGMVPVEAMAHGVPVIAYKSGGVTETVIEGKTGIFFPTYTATAIAEILKNFKPKHYPAAACRIQAQKFSSQRFDQQVRKIVATEFKKMSV